jgi:hypothetical protein
VRAHPVAFGSAIVRASLLGGVGAVLALPVTATITALVQTYGDHHDVISSGGIESPKEYEARMHEFAREKDDRRRERRGRWRELAGFDDDTAADPPV